MTDAVADLRALLAAKAKPRPAYDAVYAAAVDTLTKGAPGLTEVTRGALANSIALKAEGAVAATTADLLGAAEKALNFIANTEGEFGMTLESGDALRAAISKASNSKKA